MIEDTTPNSDITSSAHPIVHPYHKLDDLLELMEPHHRHDCDRMIADYVEVMRTGPGSRHNHQAWAGGYLAHIVEGMNLIVVLFDTLNRLRPLTYSLSSALFIFFIHDLEKLGKYRVNESGQYEVIPRLATKQQERDHRNQLLERYAIVLTDEERIAFRYVEGEEADYSSTGPRMNPLGALCHMADVASARMWPHHPINNDPWRGSEIYADPSK